MQLFGFKKILFFGGWSFFVELFMYYIFCDVVKLVNQDMFVVNIVLFVIEYELDGIDIDWECKLVRGFFNQ